MGIFWGTAARVLRRDPVIMFLRWRVWRRFALPSILGRCADAAELGGVWSVVLAGVALVLGAGGAALGAVLGAVLGFAGAVLLDEAAHAIRREARR